MIDISLERFRALGLHPAMAQQLTLHAKPPDTPQALVRVTGIHRETLTVHDGLAQHAARVRPRLLRELMEHDDTLTVGDWVLTSQDGDGPAWIEQRIAPLTRITRRDAHGHRHAVVSNVDTALLVMGLDLDYNPKRLERYLALVQGSGVLPVVVLTKADTMAGPTGGDDGVADRLRELRQRIGDAVDMLAVDARAPHAARSLAPYLGPGQTLVLLGSSGAGKSTLTNTLLGVSTQDTGPVREHDNRGRHTTTSRTLHCLPGGACVIDTPGVRALRPDLDAQTLSGLYGDVAELAGRCRFRDYQHLDEPGCAVREALHPQRLNNYHKLQREARRDTMSMLERQRQLSEWKARGRAGRQRLELKKGGW